MHVAVGVDPLQIHTVAYPPVHYCGYTPVLELREAVAGGIAGVDVSCLETRVVGQIVVVWIAVRVDSIERRRERHVRGRRAQSAARQRAQYVEGDSQRHRRL